MDYDWLPMIANHIKWLDCNWLPSPSVHVFCHGLESELFSILGHLYAIKQVIQVYFAAAVFSTRFQLRIGEALSWVVWASFVTGACASTTTWRITTATATSATAGGNQGWVITKILKKIIMIWIWLSLKLNDSY